MAEEVRRLSAFPRNDLLEEPAVTGRVSELELHEHLGPPTTESPSYFEDPRQFWDLEWPCGLVMGIEYHQLSEQLIMHLDVPDVEHALRHVGVELRSMEPSFDLKRDRFDRLTPLSHRGPRRSRPSKVTARGHGSREPHRARRSAAGVLIFSSPSPTARSRSSKPQPEDHPAVLVQMLLS